MSYTRTLIRLLDRPGGRLLLGKIATRAVQRETGDDIEISYVNGLWTRRVGSDFFPDSPSFNYTHADFENSLRQMELYASDTKEYWLRHYTPGQGDVIMDVGAGRGEDTVTFSRAVGPAGRVLAIEAHPLSFAILKNFCRLNRLTNVKPLHLALMDKPGAVRLAQSPSSWTENSVVSHNGSPLVEVSAETMDALCTREGIHDIAFLKMNVEGAESYALLGMKRVMPCVRQICVACHDFRAEMGHGEQFRTRAFVERFLTDHGFTLASRPDDPRGYVRDHLFGLRH